MCVMIYVISVSLQTGAHLPKTEVEAERKEVYVQFVVTNTSRTLKLIWRCQLYCGVLAKTCRLFNYSISSVFLEINFAWCHNLNVIFFLHCVARKRPTEHPMVSMGRSTGTDMWVCTGFHSVRQQELQPIFQIWYTFTRRAVQEECKFSSLTCGTRTVSSVSARPLLTWTRRASASDPEMMSMISFQWSSSSLGTCQLLTWLAEWQIEWVLRIVK